MREEGQALPPRGRHGDRVPDLPHIAPGPDQPPQPLPQPALGRPAKVLVQRLFDGHMERHG